MDHSELINELPILEQMGTQERQKLAKRRRLDQIKRWSRAEKELLNKERQQLKKNQVENSNGDGGGLKLRRYISRALDNDNNNVASTIKQKVQTVQFDAGVTLLEAAARNDIDEVRRLLISDITSVNSATADGLTALHQCCIDANEAMSKLLIEFGANVNAKDADQWTPLHAACTCGHLNLVKHLVENGAELLLANSDGNFPYDICEDEATLEYIESEMSKRGITQEQIDYTRAMPERQMLLDLEEAVREGKSLEWRNEQQATMLHVAAANGYLSVVEFLLDQGVDVNACDIDLWQPLHAAACWSPHPRVIEALIKSGAQTDSKTLDGETPLDICEDPEIKELMIRLKDEVEAAAAAASQIDQQSASNSLRLRRSQSRTNTRTHSVRRTSIRDKSNISRREARQEANLRQLPASTPGSATTINNVQLSNQTTNINNDCDTITSNGSVPTTSGITIVSITNKNTNVSTINADELAIDYDKSKQIPGKINGQINKHHQDDNNHVDNYRQQIMANDNNISPPSPSLGLRKYKGDPIEVFGDDSNKSSCCSIL